MWLATNPQLPTIKVQGDLNWLGFINIHTYTSKI